MSSFLSKAKAEAVKNGVGPAGGAADSRKARRRTAGHKPDVIRADRLPPNAPEAEQGVLGCALMSPDDCLGQCAQKLPAGPEVFYDLRHQTIYSVMLELYEQREPIDVITVQQRLKDRQLLEQVGGIPYLNALLDAVPSAANLTYYTEFVQEKYLLRKLIHACSDVVGKAYDFEGKVEELLDEAEREVMAVRGSSRKDDRPTVKQAVQSALLRIEDKFQRQGALTGLATGFPDLDMVLDGLCPGNLIVPCAFTSGGKTALAMNFVEHCLFALNLPAMVVSLEMTADELVERMLASQARVNMRSVARGAMAESDFPKLTLAAGRVAASNLHIVDNVTSLSGIIADARRYRQQHGIRLLVVDYIQLVENDRMRRDGNREQEVSGIVAALKRLAKELDIPVVAPSQLNKDGGLRESEATGMHANVVLMIECKTPEGDENDYVDSEPVDIFVKKNRNGPRNVRVPLTFMKQFTRFESAAKAQED